MINNELSALLERMEEVAERRDLSWRQKYNIFFDDDGTGWHGLGWEFSSIAGDSFDELCDVNPYGHCKRDYVLDFIKNAKNYLQDE